MREKPVLVLVVLLALLVFLWCFSLFVGSRNIAPLEILTVLFQHSRLNDTYLIIVELRLPRGILAILAGAALGGAGLMMQAISRNPLAEPGLIGVNAGAALAVIVGVSFFHITAMIDYVWFGFLGSGLAASLVFLNSQITTRAHNPLRLILAGIGLSVVFGAMTGIVLANAETHVFDQFRYWSAGSTEGRGFDVVLVLSSCVTVGLSVAWFLAGRLNILALGQESSASLGVPVRSTYLCAFIVIMILAGGTTAAVGPIGFIGLVAPHLAKFFFPLNYRWLMPASALIAAILLLLADSVGRIITSAGEVPAGIITLLLGGPFLVIIVRRFRQVKYG